MFLTRDHVRDYDRRAIHECGMPGVLLMENAGRGAAELVLRQSPQHVVVCCGKGNNGGDGFVIARRLDNAGVTAEVILFAGPRDITGDAAIMLAILRHTRVPINEYSDTVDLRRRFAASDWIIDALFGTGLTGPARPPFDEAIMAINDSGKRVLAVDIPSGLDCDTGRPMGAAIRATMTATFVAAKTGFAAAEAKPFLGDVYVIDIGAPRTLLAKYEPGITPP